MCVCEQQSFHVQLLTPRRPAFRINSHNFSLQLFHGNNANYFNLRIWIILRTSQAVHSKEKIISIIHLSLFAHLSSERSNFRVSGLFPISGTWFENARIPPEGPISLDSEKLAVRFQFIEMLLNRYFCRVCNELESSSIFIQYLCVEKANST